MNILQTDRLILSHLSLEDAPFILELLNDAAFLQFVGDKGVRTLEDAHAYITNGPMASYTRHGFGLFRIVLRVGEAPIGICGLLKRVSLPDVDVGYALLPQYRGQGYAVEATRAVVAYGQSVLGLRRIVAVTLPDNDRSINVLEKAGLRFEKMVRLSEEGTPCSLFATMPPVPTLPTP